MKDRKTVMSWLEGLTQDDWEVWYSDSEVQETAKAALELLKEQEAEYVEIVDGDYGKTHWYVCGGCKTPIYPGDRYCHECGRPVKWS